MKKALIYTALGVTLLGTAGCFDSRNPNNDNPAPPPAPPPASTTSQLITTASSPDDIGEPFSINDGAFAFNDTRDDTDPVPINR